MKSDMIPKILLNLLTFLFAHTPLVVFAAAQDQAIDTNNSNKSIIQKQSQQQIQQQTQQQTPQKTTEQPTQTPIQQTTKETSKQTPEADQSQTKIQNVQNNNNEVDQFFIKNAKNPGVISLPDGLQYKILKPGTGATSPGPRDFVKLRYQGKRLDGTIFDSSDNFKDKSEIFEVYTLIYGLEEAVQLMKPGAVFEVYVPPQLGYGAKGVKGKVPPNSPLIFNVELVDIVPRPDDTDTNILEREDVQERQEL